MPKVKIDYSNTIFYKIYCKDPNIAELYIGHTTNFVQRKHAHKQTCSNIKSSSYTCKLYEVIRNNDGWDNWKMDIIAFHECHDLFSAKKYEQQYFEEFKATLNSIEPLPKPKPKVIKEVIKKEKPILYCELCNVYFDTIKLQEAHNKTKKHIKKKESGCEPNMEIYCAPKNANKFNCDNCDFQCSKKSEWNRHIMTLKHLNADKRLTNADKKTPKNAKSFGCDCGNTYKHRQSLHKHQIKCFMLVGVDNKQTIGLVDHNSLTEKIIDLIMSKNQEFLSDFMDKMVHIIPTIHNTDNSTTTMTNNNQFNINMFLNEQCKNAMNIGDFIRSLPITAQHFENTKNNGLTDTLTNMMVDGLNNMEIIERPIHCTDQKRKVMYVKDNDKWERDNNHKIITKNVSDLAKMQRTMVKLWQEENPNFKTVENLQTDFTNILSNLFTSVEENKKEVSKILKAVTDTTYLDDDMKQHLLTC
jgi:hypothetical protein